ncbi:MAG: flavodoxin family protein [Spirochaetaceae bacterium]|jgi:flavodoxin|nr:flavodoxin family protein [Spirochaetaceae bacterium]
MNGTGEERESAGLVVYSSKTGNTRKLAQGIHRGLEEALGTGIRLAAVEDNPDPSGSTWILAGFWADRGNADQKALNYLKSLEGRSVGLFGTLGAYPDSAHAGDIAQKAKDAAAEKNTVLGCFLCQGKIDPALTERFKNLPADNPHAMTEERMRRHREAEKHPDENDIASGISSCLARIKTALLGAAK